MAQAPKNLSRLLAGLLVLASGAILRAQPGELIDTGGRRVHIYCTGQGSPTVIVVSGGFSVDWVLVQPNVIATTRICTYDTAGTAWSDPLPDGTPQTCAARVEELHQLLVNAEIQTPVILTGYSIGGLIARLYTARYPDEVSGIVFIDHAFIDTHADPSPPPTPPNSLDSPPVLISAPPITLDMADDENFNKLPEQNRKLHLWALTHSVRPTPEMAAVCFSDVEKIEKPLGAKPVVVVSTPNKLPHYQELQRKLLSLSTNSKQYVAENSSHMVIIDRPDVVILAIQAAIAVVRNQ